jgi:murein DD-endopeptidase MepM/ murein hydrolase activator NlpD
MRRVLALGERLGGVGRLPRGYFAAVPIALFVLLAAVRTDPTVRTASAMAVVMPSSFSYADLVRVEPPSDLPPHSILLEVQDGDTLESVFAAGGLNRQESAALTEEFGRTVDPRRLKPGSLVRFHHDSGARIDSIELRISGWGAMDALRNGDRFAVTANPAPVQSIQTSIAARIDSSLYASIAQTGEGPQLVQELVDVFQWDVDFFTLQRGDSFSVVVDKKFAGPDVVGYGPILAARFVHSGQTFEAFRGESDGRTGYYTAQGTPLRKQFLRAPLKFTRITSGFSQSRYHPILHLFRPHHGVDYGAPTGTPVMTTADGVVVEAGRKRGEGNFIRIRHNARIETSYLHLSRFATGLRRGTKVQQGDVVGFVGATGLATGPHLDYRVSDGGVWLDPLHLRSITPDPLHGEALGRFRASVARLGPRLPSPGRQGIRTATLHRALF